MTEYIISPPGDGDCAFGALSIILTLQCKRLVTREELKSIVISSNPEMLNPYNSLDISQIITILIEKGNFRDVYFTRYEPGIIHDTNHFMARIHPTLGRIFLSGDWHCLFPYVKAILMCFSSPSVDMKSIDLYHRSGNRVIFSAYRLCYEVSRSQATPVHQSFFPKAPIKIVKHPPCPTFVPDVAQKKATFVKPPAKYVHNESQPKKQDNTPNLVKHMEFNRKFHQHCQINEDAKLAQELQQQLQIQQLQNLQELQISQMKQMQEMQQLQQQIQQQLQQQLQMQKQKDQEQEQKKNEQEKKQIEQDRVIAQRLHQDLQISDAPSLFANLGLHNFAANECQRKFAK